MYQSLYFIVVYNCSPAIFYLINVILPPAFLGERLPNFDDIDAASDNDSSVLAHNEMYLIRPLTLKIRN